jgi:ParB family chromosome partitioning protein
MLDGNISVRDAEKKVSNKKTKTHKRNIDADPNLIAHEKRLREILGTKVAIQERKGKGKIIIDYYSRDDLIDLLDRLSE